MKAAFLPLVAGLLALLSVAAARAQLPPTDLSGPPTNAPAPGTGLSRWFNPRTAPFIPVPEIAVDPDSGTTLGVLPTWIKTDENHAITKIIAPDLLHNPYFGWGAHARVFAYPSEDEQWSLVAGLKQRVERELDGEFQVGRAREGRWSFAASLIFDRSGTPRFYGFGNRSRLVNQTNYTDEQELAQAQIGYNISKIWQVLFTARKRVVNVLPGTLRDVPSIEQRFGHVAGLGSTKELLNRISIIYDTRDDQSVPSHGMKWVAYAGVASRGGIFNDSLYSETGVDGRVFLPLAPKTILAMHLALRYLPSVNNIPFWAYSSLGGGTSEIGGQQPLRGFGGGRFYGRNSFSTTFELRRQMLSFDAISTHVDIEITPFVDLGRVFSRTGTLPFINLHKVAGVGFRGIARPFVVGYVDIGYGSEGTAVFTGISYPF